MGSWTSAQTPRVGQKVASNCTDGTSALQELTWKERLSRCGPEETDDHGQTTSPFNSANKNTMNEVCNTATPLQQMKLVRPCIHS